MKLAFGKSSKLATIVIFGGGLLGFLANRFQRRDHPVPVRSGSSGAVAMRRLTAYFIIPAWMSAAFLDYIWHRRTKIETTSGSKKA